MKHNRLFLVFMAIIIALSLFLGCDILSLDNEGTLVITFEDAQSRSLVMLPDIDIDIAVYNITGNGPNNASFSVQDFSEDVFIQNGLVVGDWIISVEGFNHFGEKIAESEDYNVLIKKNNASTTNIMLSPVNGLGELSITINWEDSLARINNPEVIVTIRDKEGEIIVEGPDTFIHDTETFSVSANYTLENGWYEATIGLYEVLSDDTREAIWQDVVAIRIVTGESTIGNINIEEDTINFGTGNLNITILSNMSNPFEISFMDLPDTLKEQEEVFLTAYGDYDEDASFRWYVNGIQQNESSDFFSHRFEEKGMYNVTLLVMNNGALACYGELVEVTETSFPEYDETFNGIILDGQGLEIPGINHEAIYSTDRFNDTDGALSFNGIDNSIELVTADKNYENFAISLWFQTSESQGVLISCNDGIPSSGQGDKRIYINNDGKLYAGVRGGPSTVNTESSVADEAWHHAVLNQDSSSFTLYVDGELIGSKNDVTWHDDFIHSSLGYNCLIADWPSRPSNLYFYGKLDDVRIYDYALTQEQISELYTGVSL